jgi:RNA polymerase-associated protein LEO1
MIDSPRKSKLIIKEKTLLALPDRSIHTTNKSNIMSIRAPNFVKFQHDEYVKDAYDADEERRTFDAAIAVARWRYQRDSNGELIKDTSGNPIKESNARLVKWSDGSYQVLIGDQIFVASANILDSW